RDRSGTILGTMTATTTSEATTKAAAARAASKRMGAISSAQKDAALRAIADALVANAPRILEVNAGDMARGKDHGISEALLDRMLLTPERIEGMARDVRAVAMLPDPVGEMLEMTTRPNGMQVGRIRVPLGVIGAVYESRPNVTVDIAVLCLKSGNGVVLR